MFEPYLEPIRACVGEISYCVPQPLTYAPCHDFWHWSGILATGLGLFCVAALVFFLLRRRAVNIKRWAAAQRQIEREQALDEAEQKRARWVSNNLAASNLSEAKIAAEIRKALALRGNDSS